ncbi:MAG: glutamate-5-semialdehyde dehydrogenase [Phycisphaerae bacterium]
MTAPAMTDLITRLGQQARRAARQLATLSGQAKNQALLRIADALIAQQATLRAANEKDLAQAQSDGLPAPLIARLTLSDKKIATMAQGVREIAAQVDPVGQTLEAYDRPNGLRIEKRRVPIGVIAIIFEARPNVTADAAALCLKSGNAVILRGGKEALHSNQAIARIITSALEASNIDPAAVQLIETTDRAAVGALVTAEGLVDLAIPRGGESLIRAVVEQATIPVIKHYRGVCHIYIDRAADLDMAVKIAVSAKTDGVALCNTAECLLVHQDIAPEVLPILAARFSEKKVELRVDPAAAAIIRGPHIKPAAPEDFGREFLDYIMALKVVPTIAAAIDHINTYGSQHTEAIITRDLAAARKFTTEVDAASVLINASTRFADGFEYGLGAEIGISTDKLHARGPMGAADLCTYKYIVTGDGHIRT